ncbi:tRNA (adenosine(37)-N6)-dimethylallyltransferase MiaA [Hufsiella ginkgonis]|uniref:tRNA dimethylallyltransferase n=1 Tax=Hufsiella ginkgonis TaxID=2695274 RepID=A0A7K1Y3M9_9SPHI|nr:tRNA (adenosine(37)-N6)-dimethylallyltransferase MiaA [Hufsiella ginkgonis]MXV17851.1 tRNA (adenosine(37)-N6)-dimethylallyltransferase MiaA [Hufsiella ginkgonis]
MPGEKKLIVVAGPTAIGKTSLAIQLAQQFDTDVISADSRQFFREMSIGTAKPSGPELTAVKHHFIDSHSIHESFSVGDFEEQGLQLLEELFKNKDIVILAGGSGLYIDAICKGFDDLPKPGKGIREELNSQYAAEGLDPLLQELENADPEYFSLVDKHNPQRIIRALEVWRSTGTPVSALRLNQGNLRPFSVIHIGLTLPREVLYERINLRVDQMVCDGLINEVTRLLPYRSLNALNTVGYKEIFEYLDGYVSLDEAISLIKQNTRRFAKRQLTWFRRNDKITWFEPGQLPEIRSFLEKELIRPGR